MKIQSITKFDEKKGEYLSPIVEIVVFDVCKDVLCMSGESYDNDYDAGGLFQGN